MRSIAQLFQRDGKKLVPFITAGFPEFDGTPELVHAAEQGGADMVEIGMPFSDPLADGPVIQHASQKALENGVTIRKILTQVEVIREKTTIPVVLMGYINPIVKYGIHQFLQDARSAGVSGLILPDLPPEEGEKIYSEIKTQGMSSILLVAPNTASDRMTRIGAMAEDLLYAVSILGVTGSGITQKEKLKNYLRRIRQATDVPFVVGFGISTTEDVRSIAPMADGIVVGSALIRKIESSRHPARATEQFMSTLKKALFDS